MKIGYFNIGLYLYGIKIQTSINQISVTKYAGKSQIFLKIFFLIFFESGLDPAKKLLAASHCCMNSGRELIHFRLYLLLPMWSPFVHWQWQCCMVAVLLWWRLETSSRRWSFFFFSTLFFCPILPPAPCFIPSSTLWSFFCFCGGSCCWRRCRWRRGCCRGNEAGRGCLLQFVFFSPVQRRKPLFLCIFLPLTSLSLLLFLDDDGAVRGDWEEQWRRWWQLCEPQPVVFPLLSSVSLWVSAFLCSFTLLTPSKFLGSFLFFTPKLPPCSYLSLCPKPPLNLSFASLLLQNFAIIHCWFLLWYL